MIQLMERYDLSTILKEIKDDKNYQRPVNEHQYKDIPQQTITEIMIDNLKRKKKKHD